MVFSNKMSSYHHIETDLRIFSIYHDTCNFMIDGVCYYVIHSTLCKIYHAHTQIDFAVFLSFGLYIQVLCVLKLDRITITV